MLGVVDSNLEMVKFFIQHLWMLHDVVVVWPGSCLIFNNQHVATGWPNASNMLSLTKLQCVLKCCDRLAEACKWWANNVGICCVKSMLKSLLCSSLECADVVWDECSEFNGSLLESLQIEGARVVTGALKETSRVSLLN